MAQAKFASPTLQLTITPEDWQKAVEASSGSCLIADAIKRQYPRLSKVSVDMATIRASDTERGLRYMYLTPDDAQMLLLSFDQGWSQPTTELRISRAVKTSPIMASSKKALANRVARLAELDEKAARGESLTRREKQIRTRLRKTVTRPASTGPAKVGSNNVVHGRASVQGPPHPNLLRGRSRFFGARTAKPAEVFIKAVDEAVEKRLAELGSKTTAA